MTERWTGNPKPYQQAQEQVRRAIGAAQDSAGVIPHYQAAAQQAPADPLLQFQWAYALYRIGFIKPSLRTSKELDLTIQALANAASPHVYESARLRFVLGAIRGGYVYPLKTVGERLLRRNPKDDEVRYWLIQVLDDSLVDADKQEALSYSKMLIRSKPTQSYAYQALAWTHFVIFMKSHRLQDGDSAIAAYRQAQQYASTNPQFCAGVERLIRLIHTSQVNIAKKHNST